MILVALASVYPTEAEARSAVEAEHGHRSLAYMGTWVHPTPEQPLVHIFSDQTFAELRDAGWRQPAAEHQARLAAEPKEIS